MLNSKGTLTESVTNSNSICLSMTDAID